MIAARLRIRQRDGVACGNVARIGSLAWTSALVLAALVSQGGCATVGQPSPRVVTTAPAPSPAEQQPPAPSPEPTSPTSSPEASPEPTDTDQYVADLEDGVNAARESSDVEALTHDECAADAARHRAAALVGADELAHAPLDDVLAACEAERVGENLSRSNHPPSDIVQAWLDSPGHASNILDDRFDRGAIACVRDTEAARSPQLLCSHVFLG